MNAQTNSNKTRATIRIGAAYDEMKVSRNGQTIVLDRAAARQHDRLKGTKLVKQMNETVADSYVEDHGIGKVQRSAKRERDQKFKAKRRDREA